MKKQHISLMAWLLLVVMVLSACGEGTPQNTSQADPAPQTQETKPSEADPAAKTKEATSAAAPSTEAVPPTEAPTTEAPVQIPDALVGTWKRFGSKEILDEHGKNIQEFTVTKDGILTVNESTYLLEENVNLEFSPIVSFCGADGVSYQIALYQSEYDGTSIKGGVELFSSAFSVEGNYFYYKEGSEEYLQKQQAAEKRQYFTGVWYRFRDAASENVPQIMMQRESNTLYAPNRIELFLTSGPTTIGGNVMALYSGEKDQTINGLQVAYQTDINSETGLPLYAFCLLDDAPAPDCMGLLINGEGPFVYRKAAPEEERLSAELSTENWKDYLKTYISYCPEIKTDGWGDVTEIRVQMECSVMPADVIWGVKVENGMIRLEFTPVSWGILRYDKVSGETTLTKLEKEELTKYNNRLENPYEYWLSYYTGESEGALYDSGTTFLYATWKPMKEAEAPNEGSDNILEFFVIYEMEINVTRIKGTMTYYEK